MPCVCRAPVLLISLYLSRAATPNTYLTRDVPCAAVSVLHFHSNLLAVSARNIMSIAINPSPAASLNNQANWKRKGSDEEDDSRGGNIKKTRYSWYVTLESESPSPTDEDEESIYTVQGNETEFAHDTSDTSTHTWISSESDNSDHVEYELDSRSEHESPFMEISSCSEPENILAFQFITFCDSDGLADNSDASKSSIDSEIRRADFGTCVQCKNPNNNPLFRYCKQCYQTRKTHFSRNRPKRKPRALMDQKKKIEEKSKLVKSTITQELSEMDSGLPSSQDIDKHISDSQINEASNIQGSSISYSKSDETGTAILSAVESGSLEGDEVDSGLASKKPESDKCPSSPDSDQSGQSHTKDKAGETSTELNSANTDGASLMSILSKKLQSFREENGKVVASIPNTETENNRQLEGLDNLCLICTVQPKNGAFIHGKNIHICCCYRCAMKVWTTNNNRCPICNRKVTQILKVFYG